MGEANAPDYWRHAGRHAFVLDLTHEVTADLSHGLVLKMTRARSGLKALAGVLQRWVRHFLGVGVTMRPLQKIDDDAWRWHLRLDTESTALLNDLYEGRDVAAQRLNRPVYLGLMMNAEGMPRVKPQNLPLRACRQ